MGIGCADPAVADRDDDTVVRRCGWSRFLDRLCLIRSNDVYVTTGFQHGHDGYFLDGRSISSAHRTPDHGVHRKNVNFDGFITHRICAMPSTFVSIANTV